MDEIEADDYEKMIRKIYQEYFSRQKGLKEYQKKSKTIQYLLSRGFEYDAILDVNTESDNQRLT